MVKLTRSGSVMLTENHLPNLEIILLFEQNKNMIFMTNEIYNSK